MTEGATRPFLWYSTVQLTCPVLTLQPHWVLRVLIQPFCPVLQHTVSPFFQSFSTSLSTAPQPISSAAPLLPGPDYWTTISSQLFLPLPPHTSPSHEPAHRTPWWNESVFLSLMSTQRTLHWFPWNWFL